MNDNETIWIWYTNYKGEAAWRHIVPKRIEFASAPPWHPDPQWLLHAHDIEKNAERIFTLKEIQVWSPTKPEEKAVVWTS